MCLRINPIFVTSELSSQPIDLESNRLGQHKDFCTTLGWQEQNFKACSIGIESFGFWRKRGKNTKRVSFETKTKAFTRNDLLFFLAHLELVVDALSHRYGMDVIAVSHALAYSVWIDCDCTKVNIVFLCLFFRILSNAFIQHLHDFRQFRGQSIRNVFLVFIQTFANIWKELFVFRGKW